MKRKLRSKNLSRLRYNGSRNKSEVARLKRNLSAIEKRIHQSKNRTKDAMNNALIPIGLRNSELEKKALEVARRIGKVEVDHGETGCKTPDAVPYIMKARKRKNKRRD